MRCPSWMPAGTSTFSVRSASVRPAPSHSRHGVSTSTPRPRQSGHGCARTNSPNTLRETWCSRPLPSQRAQVRGCVPGSTPSPPHAMHVAATSHGTGTMTPRAAPARLARRAAEDAVTEQRGEQVAEVAHVEVRRREAAGTQAGVAVAVVERAALGAREHLVRLGDLAEPHLRLRVVGDVGMELACEPAERLLDRRLVGVARDAEQLVVVAVGRGHQSSPYTSSTKRDSSWAAERTERSAFS